MKLSPKISLNTKGSILGTLKLKPIEIYIEEERRPQNTIKTIPVHKEKPDSEVLF